MAPSTLLASRISAFESLGASSSSSTSTISPPRASSKGPPKPPNLLETPISPQASALSLITPNTPPKSASRSPSPAPSLASKTSLIDLKDWVVDVGPSHSPPQQNGYVHRINGAGGSTRRPKTSGETEFNGHKSNSAPLINLESPPRTKSIKAPPLPPRKPSYTSLKSVSSVNSVSNRSNDSNSSLHPPPSPNCLTVEHTYPPWSKLSLSDASRKGHAPTSSVSSFHSVSLSSDGGTPDPATSGPASNQSAVSQAQQDGGCGDDNDSICLGESFENVSTTPSMSPTTASSIAKDWEKAMAKQKPPPPKLPQRPQSATSRPSPPLPTSSQSVPTSPKIRPYPTSSLSSTATNTRRAAPPPPLIRVPPPPHSYRASLTSASAPDRSSTASHIGISARTSTQSLKHTIVMRPTPVPAVARKRYEALFVANVVQCRRAEKTRLARLPHSEAKKSRHAAGWRGLSVDLITAAVDPSSSQAQTEKAEELKVDEMVGPKDRLNGGVVRMVWSSSRLEKGKLRAIWNECDTTSLGSLDRDAFVKGMWRIDEELRKARGDITRQYSSSSSASSSIGSYRIRQPPNPTNPKIILR